MSSLLRSLSAAVSAARRATVSDKWGARGYRDGYARIYCVESGEGAVRHHDETYRLVPGRIFYIPAYSVQDYECTDRMVLHYIHFTLALFGGVSAEPLLHCRYVAPSDNLSSFRRLEELAGSDDDGAPARDIEMSGIVLQLLAPFVVAAREESGVTREVLRFRPVFEYVDAHLDRPTRVADLAELMQLNRSYFSRRFRSLFGSSPERYILRRKIQHASELLRDTDSSVANVAAALGFADAYHFSRTFRNLTGLSPSQSRRQGAAGP